MLDQKTFQLRGTKLAKLNAICLEHQGHTPTSPPSLGSDRQAKPFVRRKSILVSRSPFWEAPTDVVNNEPVYWYCPFFLGLYKSKVAYHYRRTSESNVSDMDTGDKRAHSRWNGRCHLVCLSCSVRGGRKVRQGRWSNLPRKGRQARRANSLPFLEHQRSHCYQSCILALTGDTWS